MPAAYIGALPYSISRPTNATVSAGFYELPGNDPVAGRTIVRYLRVERIGAIVLVPSPRARSLEPVPGKLGLQPASVGGVLVYRLSPGGVSIPRTQVRRPFAGISIIPHDSVRHEAAAASGSRRRRGAP